MGDISRFDDNEGDSEKLSGLGLVAYRVRTKTQGKQDVPGTQTANTGHSGNRIQQ